MRKMILREALFQLKEGEEIINVMQQQINDSFQEPVLITQNQAKAVVEIINNYTRLMLQQDVGSEGI